MLLRVILSIYSNVFSCNPVETSSHFLFRCKLELSQRLRTASPLSAPASLKAQCAK